VNWGQAIYERGRGQTGGPTSRSDTGWRPRMDEELPLTDENKAV